MDQHTINTFSLSHYSLLNCQITFPSITSKRLATDVFFSIKMPQITFTYHYRNFGTLFGVKSSTHRKSNSTLCFPFCGKQISTINHGKLLVENTLIHIFCGIWFPIVDDFILRRQYLPVCVRLFLGYFSTIQTLPPGLVDLR